MKTAEEIALEYGLCNCDEAYKSRNLEAPDCHWHSTALEEAMKAYAKQVAEQALKDAGENATFEIVETAFMEEEVRINNQSILQTEIKLP